METMAQIIKGVCRKENANQLFIMQYDKVNYDSTIELRTYMKSQGVDLDKDVLDRLTDFGGGVYNWFGGVLILVLVLL